jgi:hypothetical protein
MRKKEKLGRKRDRVVAPKISTIAQTTLFLSLFCDFGYWNMHGEGNSMRSFVL